jgi:hypothetical protein
MTGMGARMDSVIAGWHAAVQRFDSWLIEEFFEKTVHRAGIDPHNAMWITHLIYSVGIVTTSVVTFQLAVPYFSTRGVPLAIPVIGIRVLIARCQMACLTSTPG